MNFFKRKEENKINKNNGNDIINQLALQEALRELKEERAINDGLVKGIEDIERENKEAKEILEKYNKIKNKKYNYDKYKEENETLKENLEVMINSYDKIKEICNQSKTSKIAKAILKELGE